MKKTKDLITLADLEAQDFIDIFKQTNTLKSNLKSKKLIPGPLKGKTLGMIFEKPSTRTSISFAVGMYQLGGLPLILSAQDLQLHRGESVADTARVLSRYVDIIMIRANKHQSLVDMASQANVPVINGLTEQEHPCQILADIYTIAEKKLSQPAREINWEKLSFDEIKLTYVGDGNNIANTLMLASALLGFTLHIACPKGYEPDKNIYELAGKLASGKKGKIIIEHDPAHAVRGADVIYTDVWTSMGKEKEKEIRKTIFQPFQVNSKLVESSKNRDVIIMHCMPAHRGHEITDEVIDSGHSVVFDQAENRLHVQKAIILNLLKNVIL
ncbi:MAG: ornithine carbamoyltransferase [bacterium]